MRYASDIIKMVLLFLLYYVTATFGLHLDAVSGFATLFWIPTGVSLAVLYRWGYRLGPAVFLGAFFVNLQTGAPLPVALGIAMGNTLEAFLGVYTLKRFSGSDTSLERTTDVLTLIIGAAGISTLISATIGTTSLWLGGMLSDAYSKTWLA